MTEDIWNKQHLLRYAGSLEQLCGIRSAVLTEAKARNVRVLDVRSGSGLSYSVLPDRAFDIAGLGFRGTNLSYFSSTGIVGPAFYEAQGANWLRSFQAGFLTTCGLRNVGSPNTESGEELGLHGRIANIPAELHQASTDWVDDHPVMTIRGQVRESSFFGENLVLRRTITTKAGENRLIIEDGIENEGFRVEPLTLLYHFNLGYPLLDAGTRLFMPAAGTAPRDEQARLGLDSWHRMQAPTPGFQEQVYYHDLRADAAGRTWCLVENPRLELAVLFRWNLDALPRVSEWKQMGEGAYVLGIEPGNCRPEGRSREKALGSLEYLQPGAAKHCRLEIEILSGAAAIGEALRQIMPKASVNPVTPR
jgi:hypothetical protein